MNEKDKKALESRKKQLDRQNEYIKDNFERVSVVLPKGTKDKIKASGESINGLINRLLSEYLEKNSLDQDKKQNIET